MSVSGAPRCVTATNKKVQEPYYHNTALADCDKGHRTALVNCDKGHGSTLLARYDKGHDNTLADCDKGNRGVSIVSEAKVGRGQVCQITCYSLAYRHNLSHYTPRRTVR